MNEVVDEEEIIELKCWNANQVLVELFSLAKCLGSQEQERGELERLKSECEAFGVSLKPLSRSGRGYIESSEKESLGCLERH